MAGLVCTLEIKALSHFLSLGPTPEVPFTECRLKGSHKGEPQGVAKRNISPYG